MGISNISTNFTFISGQDSVFGREFLADIVKRKNADIGINAGFFEIAGNDDGMPCGALFIDGKFYGMQSKNLPCIIKKGSKVEIKNLQPSLAIFIGNNEFKINRFNKYINNKQTYLYNDSWGKSTLSNYNTRTEIIISSDSKLLEISSHGDSKIPDGGYVISLPGNYKLPKMQVGDKVAFKWQPDYLANQDTSVVLGMPLLIQNGEILADLNNKNRSARTAFGITSEGQYVIVIAESFNAEKLKQMTMQEVNKILKKEGAIDQDLTLSQAKKLIYKNLNLSKTAQGLTIEELAKYMLKLDCTSAIALDGGGSTSFFMDGKYINEAYGDSDEGLGVKKHRALSNAIIFTKK